MMGQRCLTRGRVGSCLLLDGAASETVARRGRGGAAVGRSGTWDVVVWLLHRPQSRRPSPWRCDLTLSIINE